MSGHELYQTVALQGRCTGLVTVASEYIQSALPMFWSGSSGACLPAATMAPLMMTSIQHVAVLY